MIYFKNAKKCLGMDFIDINIPENLTQLEAYYKTREQIFCKEQGLFNKTDKDEKDKESIPIIAINHYLGSPDEVVGVVRIYEEKEREWFGGRLAVTKDYRTFSKYVCPNLFSQQSISPLYSMSVAAGLIYRAVSLANYLGCDKFFAYVQEQNVKLFKRLNWKVVQEVDLHGVTHFLMEAILEAYPATPIYTHSESNLKSISKINKVA